MKNKLVECKLHIEYGGKPIPGDQHSQNRLSVTLRLTNNCSYRCEYCGLFRVDEEFAPLENFLAINRTLVKTERDCYEFYIHGGEPSIHPQFHQIIADIHQVFQHKNLWILIQTNLFKPAEAYIDLPDSVKYLVSYHPARTTFDVFQRKVHQIHRAGKLECVDFMLEGMNREEIKADFQRLRQTEYGHKVRPRTIYGTNYPQYDRLRKNFEQEDRQYLLTYEDGSTRILPEWQTKRQSFMLMKCEAQYKQVIVDPDGSYWGCQTQMMRQGAEGNILKNPRDFLKYTKTPITCCWFNCSCEIHLRKWRGKGKTS
jgi:MoaA/NifB/PqqE/SkfB family radical SAM enzyme